MTHGEVVLDMQVPSARLQRKSGLRQLLSLAEDAELLPDR
jgi:hypothetical protein